MQSRAVRCAVVVFATLATLAASALLPRLATAQGTNYSALIDDAMHEYELGNYAEARSLFGQAHSSQPSARTQRALGICDYELKHYVLASSELSAALVDTEKPLNDSQRTETSDLLDLARRYVGVLELETRPLDASLVLDGQAVNERRFQLDLGDHVIAGSAPGFRSGERHVSVLGGQTQRALLVLTPNELDAPRPTPPPVAFTAPPTAAGGAVDQSRAQTPALWQRWWFWPSLGVIVAAAAVGTVLAISANSSAVDGGSTHVTLNGP
jgi:hypothetical protein